MQENKTTGKQSAFPQTVETADEISLNDFIGELGLWKQLVLRHWFGLLVLGLLGGSLGFLYAWLDTPLYIANTRFMLKNEGVGSLFGGQMSTLSGLLGGGQMGTPLERTAEVIASDRIVGKVLLRDMTLGDTTDLVINHFIRLTNIRNKWVKDTMLNKVSFSNNDRNIEILTLAQRKAYKYIKTMLVPEKGTGVVRKAFDKKSGVLTLTCAHSNESFAIGLSKVMYNELGLFFVEQMSSSSFQNAQIVKDKIDSIQQELNIVRKMYAQQTDQSLGLLLQQDKVALKTLAVKEQMLNVMYAEAVKNYETYQFVSQAALPSLTLIDEPFAPIKPLRKSKILYSFFISFCLVFLGFIYVRGIIFFKKMIDANLVSVESAN